MPAKAGGKVQHLMMEKEAIALEPTYTAKTFAAVYDYCQNRDKDSGPILYWHTFNSVDLSAQANEVDHRELPKPLQRFITQRADK